MSEPFLALLPRLLQLIENADEPLSLAELSARSGYSAWHLHRQFRFYCGLPLQSYQRLLKLQRAASALAYRQTPVTELALEAGYQNAESFSRAFARWLGQAPAQFRQQPDWQYWAQQTEPLNQISRTDTTNLADSGLRTERRDSTVLLQWLHQGNPESLGDSIRRFIEFRRSNKLHPSRFATFNLLYDDPQDCVPDDYRFGLALQLSAAQPELLQQPELSMVTVPAGLYACYDHVGPDVQLDAVIRALYTELLPTRDWLPADVPLLLERVQFFPDVPAHQAHSRIWLALQTD